MPAVEEFQGAAQDAGGRLRREDRDVVGRLPQRHHGAVVARARPAHEVLGHLGGGASLGLEHPVDVAPVTRRRRGRLGRLFEVLRTAG